MAAHGAELKLKSGAVRVLRKVVRRGLVRLGLRQHLVSPLSVRRVDLPYKIASNMVPAYVLVYDSLHTSSGRVKIEVPPQDIQPRADFIAHSDPVIQLCFPGGKSFGGVAVSRLTGCLELMSLPSQNWLKLFYEKYFGNASGVEMDAVRKVAADIRVKRNVDKVYRYVKHLFTKPGRVFDIGCGYGDQLAIFAANGWDVRGIEPSIMRRLVAKELYGVTPYDGGVEDLGVKSLAGLAPASFDLVMLNQVLEHVSDPYRTLTAAKQFLKPDGYLFVAVPDLELESVFALHNNFTHVRSYTGEALRAELGLAGFRVIEDAAVLGYNVLIAKVEEGVDVSSFRTHATRRAQSHVARLFPREGEDERLVIVTHPIYKGRTIVYRWQGMTPPSHIASGPMSVVTPGLVGSFQFAEEGAEF